MYWNIMKNIMVGGNYKLNVLQPGKTAYMGNLVAHSSDYKGLLPHQSH